MVFSKKGIDLWGAGRGVVGIIVALLLGGCSGGTGGERVVPPGVPCPTGGPIAPAGEGRYLFFKVACDPSGPLGLWAVDPANPAATPIEVEPEMIPGSLQIIADGRWDTAAGKIVEKRDRFLVFAKRDGKLYRVSALKADLLAPVQISNETGAGMVAVPVTPGRDASLICGASALPDYADTFQSIYFYVLAGPDNDCSFPDDNIQKIVRIGMSPSDSPLSVPRDRSHLFDYEAPFSPGVAPGSASPNDLVPVIDLVEKNSGGLTAWLAVKNRTQPHRPAFPFTADAASDVIITPTEHGLFEGTRIFLSGGGLPGGVDPNKIYSIHVTSPTTFKLYRMVKRQVTERSLEGVLETKIRLEGGRGSLRDTHPADHIHTDGGNPHVGAAEHKHGDADEPHIDINMVDFSSNGAGTFQSAATLTDLFRCNRDLAECVVLKETQFVNTCKVEGDNQTGSLDASLGAPFVVESTDAFGNPVGGIAVHWRGGDNEDDPEDEDDITPLASSTGGDGRTGAVGILREAENDPQKNINTYTAAVAESGSPLVFQAGTQIEKPLLPSCRLREDFFMIGVTPLGYGNLFTGKMVIRFDLLYKPNPSANAQKVKGALYVYDVAANTFSPLRYTSPEGFLEGVPFIADATDLFFADQGSLYRLPLDGGSDATLLAAEGKRVEQIDVTTGRVAYTLVDESGDVPRRALKTVGKGGGGPVTLLSFTEDSLLPILTGGGFVYYQTMGASFDPPGVVSKIFSAQDDGSRIEPLSRAGFAGRSENRILAAVQCAEFTFSCAGGTLVSFDPLNPFGEALTLGPIPSDIESLFFDGLGNGLLGEGDAFEGPADDPGDGKGTEIFYVVADQANSLVRVTDNTGVGETLP